MTNDDYEMINGKLCLKDGPKHRASMRAMDAAPDDRMHLTDAAGRAGTYLNRPGYRCLLEDDIGRVTRERAYELYDTATSGCLQGRCRW
jgi:hypothetical protein